MMDTVQVVGKDRLSTLVECDGMVYRLTNCCQASATGTEWGTACRACYHQIPESMGMAWVARTSPMAEQFYPEPVSA